MKRLWLKGANSVSRYHAGSVKFAGTFDTMDKQPAPCNERCEVLLDSHNGLIRYQAFCLLRSGQVEWNAAHLVQEVGGYYKVIPLAKGISFADAAYFSDGALAACEIAAEKRNATYQPHTERKQHKVRGKRTKKAKKSGSGSRKTSLNQSTISAALDIFNK